MANSTLVFAPECHTNLPAVKLERGEVMRRHLINMHVDGQAASVMSARV